MASDAAAKMGVIDLAGLAEPDIASATPTIEVRTYSTFYDVASDELPDYAAWYKAREQPQMSDEEFNDADNFTIALTDFKSRFGQ